ncbi:MAG: DUF2267 domain-containing protein [Leptolyngbya sp. SIO4C1]|nr:DUF2267 domain-containing protein [Leptolyngbya sp. SIO4C1]
MSKVSIVFFIFIENNQKFWDFLMSNNLQEGRRSDPSTEIAAKDMDFLQKVMAKGNMSDVYDARDLTEIVFRTMRDLMTTEAAADVADELRTPASAANERVVKEDIADLWKDSNPIVRFLSQVRPALEFDDDTFLFRIAKEGGLPQTTGSDPKVTPPETVVSAVFSATKDELSEARIAEIANFLPGKVRTLWEAA